jgi:hypothetical protein
VVFIAPRYKLFTKFCRVFNAFHRESPPKQGTLHTMVLGGVGERWNIDLTGSHCLSDGYKYLFTAIDPFSKDAIAVPIRNKQYVAVRCVIVDHLLQMGSVL